MKQKIAHFIGGFIIYSLVGLLTVVMMDNEMPNKWAYIAFFGVGMSLLELFIIHPLRKKISEKKTAKQSL